MRLFSGDALPEVTLVQSITDAEGTAFLLIAAGADEDEVAYNSLFHEVAPDRSTLWVIPNVGHTAGLAAVPDEYESQVIRFFTQSLLQ
jgi:hypothetical protein